MKKNVISIVFFCIISTVCQHAIGDRPLKGKYLEINITNETQSLCIVGGATKLVYGSYAGNSTSDNGPKNIPANETIQIKLSQNPCRRIEEELTYYCLNSKANVSFRVIQPWVFAEGKMPEVQPISHTGMDIKVTSITPSVLSPTPGRVNLSLVLPS